MATANLTASEQLLPTFTNAGRVAGMVGPEVYAWARATGSGVSPSTTGGDYVIGVVTIPGGTMNYVSLTGDPSTGVGFRIRAIGHFAATANNKTVKLIYNPTAAVVGSAVSGGTTLITSGTVAINGLGFVMEAYVRKIGAPNANTQLGAQLVAQFGATVISPPVPSNLTAVEASDILIAVTGNAATSASDIVLDSLDVLGMA